jgi:2-keto-4-pentenoate hydratase/2-oxohepta-3-ene-1,7-dioic acid hydratase in catechol pathway
MQAFIEAGSKAIQVARQAERYVAGKNIADQKKLAGVGALLRPNQARIIAPIPVPKKNVIMLGINYREHVDEGARARSLEIKYPDYPVFFTKPSTSVIGQFGKVINHKVTEKLDWEVELAVVIGRRGVIFPRKKLTTMFSVTLYVSI